MYLIDLFWILLRPESQLIEHKESWCDEDLIDENGLDVTKTLFSKMGRAFFFVLFFSKICYILKRINDGGAT